MDLAAMMREAKGEIMDANGEQIYLKKLQRIEKMKP